MLLLYKEYATWVDGDEEWNKQWSYEHKTHRIGSDAYFAVLQGFEDLEEGANSVLKRGRVKVTIEVIDEE